MTRAGARVLVLAVVVALAGCGKSGRTLAPPPVLEDRLSGSGIDFVHRTGGGEALNIVQTVAGGVGVLDYDGDGLLDLYLVQGQHEPGPGGGNRLYRNLGGGRFEDVTEAVGVGGKGYGMGCAVGDYDADGRPDLFAYGLGGGVLYRNQGDGAFRDVTEQVGLRLEGFLIGAVFADLDGDPWPDLFVNRYVRLPPGGAGLCRMNGIPSSCAPQSYEAEPGLFFRNRGGRFHEATRQSGVVNDGRGMSQLAGDFNGDGRLDLFLANDTTANALFLADGLGRFRNAVLEAGVGYGDGGAAEGNMGCDQGDYDGDGDPDLFVGVMQERMSLLFRQESPGLYQLVSRQAGLGESTAPVVTWGCAFLDYDNDGRLDLFQANSHVQSTIDRIDPRFRFLQPCQLLRNLGDGSFSDASAASPDLVRPAAHRGAAFGDLDNDGDVDVAVNVLDGPPRLFLNRSTENGNHWLRVRLVGRHPDTMPEGAEVRLQVGSRTLVRIARTSYSYLAANDPRVHFGLGGEVRVGPLTVRWPDGTRTEASVPGVDREITVRR